MCIIITKERGHSAPSWDKIKTSTENNPHGFAFIYSESAGEKPKCFRMLDRKTFLKTIKPFMNNDDASWILHARIKSVGEICLENVHGWYDEATGLYFTHNGTLTGIREGAGMTDSETAFRCLLAPAARLGRKELSAAANAIVGYSKFALMDSKGTIIRYGNYQEEDGVCYSNQSYKRYTYTPAATNFCRNNTGWWKDSKGSWKWGNFGYEEFTDVDEEELYVDDDCIGSTKYTKHNNVFLPKTENVTKKIPQPKKAQVKKKK